MQASIEIIWIVSFMKIDKYRENMGNVFLGIAILGLTYPFLGISEGGGGLWDLKDKNQPQVFLKILVPPWAYHRWELEEHVFRGT